MSPKRLENLLNPSNNGGLADLIQRAREMGELTEVLRRVLPADSAASLVAASLRDDGELVVLAASPAWAAKLRFEADLMMAAARDAGATVTSCKVRVNRDS